MNLQLLSTYANPLSAIVTAMIANKAASAAEKDVADKRKGGLVDTLRDYARVTHADGVKATDASDALRLAMQATTDDDGKPVIPAGTVKNYTCALRGYHVMLARGQDISEVTTTAATAEVASDEQKALTAAKQAFAKLTKKWKAADWQACVDAYTLAADLPEVEAEDAADVAEAAAA